MTRERRARAPRRLAVAALGLVLPAALAPWHAAADSPDTVIIRPSPHFGDAARAALEACIDRAFVIHDINDPETPIPDCAHVGARICTVAEFGRPGKPVTEPCALAEYRWWLARMGAAVTDLEDRVRREGAERGNGDGGGSAALLRTSQAAWQAHAEAQCGYEAAMRGAGLFMCLSYQASLRAAWLLTWAGEF